MAVLPTGIGPVTGYNIERSLRFNSADSAYLNRTFVGTPNTYTLSMWIKRGSSFGSQMFIVGSRAGSSTDGTIQFNTSNQITVVLANTYVITTTAVYRDPAAWYHLVLSVTASGTAYLYINNVQVGSVAVGATCWLFNSTNTNTIGRYGSSASLYYDGYMTEVNFIDGQALTPSSFGETDSNTGVWKPKAYSGTYGTNGFFLKFADNSGTTSTTLGKDSSGNGNNWTPNNFSVTAGAGNDSLVDSPTSYGTDTGVGGEVRGNYATLNSVAIGSYVTLSEGNLKLAGNTSTNSAYSLGTMMPSSGKWYYEYTQGTVASETVGFALSQKPTGTFLDAEAFATSYSAFAARAGGTVWGSNKTVSSLTSWTNGDVVQIAIDLDNGAAYWGKNGTWQNSGIPTSGSSKTGAVATWTPSASDILFSFFGAYNAGFINANFGQRAFAYTAPSGFKALCTQNLPTPTIGATSTTQAGKYFNAVLWTGNGTTTGNTQAITGVGFTPDLVYIKGRNAAETPIMFDVIRGVNKSLYTSNTLAEESLTNTFQSFDSDGFTVSYNSAYATVFTNKNSTTYVGWSWKANGAGSSNTAGSITSTVSASTTSGFSIVTYTGTGANATVGHGLGVAPSMIIVKNRTDGTRDWLVYHASIGNTAAVFLNLTNASTALSAYWNNTSPTSSVFSLGNSSAGNGSTNSLVAYCFAPVAGYSAFGSYTGNGSTDGPFVYTGFRPRFILFKQSSASGNDWYIYDAVRSTYNVATNRLFPNSSAAEATNFNTLDILSNGWKVRDSNSAWNASGATYIYAAFAENPFKYSLAR